MKIFLDDVRLCPKGYEGVKTVEEFETYEEAVAAFEENYNDPDIYGVE